MSLVTGLKWAISYFSMLDYIETINNYLNSLLILRHFVTFWDHVNAEKLFFHVMIIGDIQNRIIPHCNASRVPSKWISLVILYYLMIHSARLLLAKKIFLFFPFYFDTVRVLLLLMHYTIIIHLMTNVLQWIFIACTRTKFLTLKFWWERERTFGAMWLEIW